MSEEWVLFFLYFEKGSLIVPSQSLQGGVESFQREEKKYRFSKGKGGGEINCYDPMGTNGKVKSLWTAKFFGGDFMILNDIWDNGASSPCKYLVLVLVFNARKKHLKILNP